MPTSAVDPHAPSPHADPPHATPTIASDGLRTDLGFFFVGATRVSGANLLVRMLNAHPEIYCGTGALVVSGDPLRCSVDQWIDPAAMDRWLARPPVAAWARDRDFDREALVHRISMAAGEAVMRGAVFGCDRKKPNIRCVGDMSLFAYGPQAQRLNALFPSSRFVSIVRDGRDVVVSGVFALLDQPARFAEFEEHERAEIERVRTWFVEDQGEPADLLPEFLLRREAKAWNVSRRGAARAREIYGDRFIEIRYEDLISDPARVGEVFSLLGVDAGEGPITAAAECIRRPEGLAVTAGIGGVWRQHFTDANLEVFKEMSGDLLIESGYETSPDW